jgi:hypothetical protein
LKNRVETEEEELGLKNSLWVSTKTKQEGENRQNKEDYDWKRKLRANQRRIQPKTERK